MKYSREDLDAAAELMDLFGPCTVVYETMTPDEVVQEMKKEGSWEKWISYRFTIEREDCRGNLGAVAQLRQIERRVRQGIKDLP